MVLDSHVADAATFWSDADMEKICESLRLTLAKLNT